MPDVAILAVRWISDDPQPGIVECRLVDADGVEHVLIDKSAIFDDDRDRLRADAAYPIELTLPCRVVAEHASDLVVELPYGIESIERRNTFRVRR